MSSFPRSPIVLPWVALLLAVAAIPLHAQGGVAVGAVAGVARDAAGLPIPAVAVTAGPASGLSDSAGAFHLAGVPAGTVTLLTRRIGYRATTQPVEVRGGETARVTLTLAPLPHTLDAVVVSATSRPAARRLRGFFERRQRAAGGHFLTREQLAVHDASYLTDAIRSRVPGVSVSNGMGPSRMRLRGSRCAPMVWLDGAPTPAAEFDLDVLPTHTIAAIEVYSGPATVPVEFRTPFGRDGCGGAVVVWSRMDRDEARAEAPRSRRRSDARSAAEQRRDSLERAIPVYHADEVDEPAALDSLQLVAPVYPDSLLAYDVPGIVMVELVVDSTGVPVPGSAGVVNATHPAFAESAQRAAAASRFHPARKGGRPVRQVLLLPYRFTDSRSRDGGSRDERARTP